MKSMAPNHPFRLILFDFDGTLVDSQQFIIAAMGSAFAAHGLATPGPEAVRRVVGLALELAVARLLPDPNDMDLARRVAASYREAFFELRSNGTYHEPLFPGVREALGQLDEPHICLGIVTGKSRRGLLSSLERHNLSEHFVTLQTADDGPSKPHPALLERAMAEVGAERAETVVIGDTTFDIEMAVNASVRAIGVAWGYHPAEELRASGADQVIEHFEQLLPCLAVLATEGA